MITYIALFSALLSRLTALACGSTGVTSFTAFFKKNIYRSGVLTKNYDIRYNFIAKCQYTDCTRNVLWCQVHSSHIHSKLKHLITTTANKHHCKKSFIDKNIKNPSGIKLCISHKIKLPLPEDPLLKVTVLVKAVIRIIYNKLIN